MIVDYRIFEDLFAFNGSGLTDNEIVLIQQTRISRYAALLEAEFNKQFPKNYRFDVYSVIDAKNTGMAHGSVHEELSEVLQEIDEKFYNGWKVENLPDSQD